MNATTTNTQDTTVAVLLAQTGDIGAEFVAQAPTAETTDGVTGKAAAAVDAVKTAAGASLSFIQEHKTAVIAVAGVTAAAGAGYAAYKWYAKRREDKRAKAEEATKTAEEAVKAAVDAAAENK